MRESGVKRGIEKKLAYNYVVSFYRGFYRRIAPLNRLRRITYTKNRSCSFFLDRNDLRESWVGRNRDNKLQRRKTTAVRSNWKNYDYGDRLKSRSLEWTQERVTYGEKTRFSRRNKHDFVRYIRIYMLFFEYYFEPRRERFSNWILNDNDETTDKCSCVRE